MSAIVWFRLDLRLTDNPALGAAVRSGKAVVPLFVWSPEEDGGWSPGGASRWWLHQSLLSLDASLRKYGSRLIIRTGNSLEVLKKIINETGAENVYWNRRYEPALIERDKEIKKALDSLKVETFNSALLVEPWESKNKEGLPFQVFTPFWKACTATLNPPKPLPAPEAITNPAAWPESLALESLNLQPKPDWATEIRAYWRPGEVGAEKALDDFLASKIALYKDDRDRPDYFATSSLSPYLHFGEISPRTIWHKVEEVGLSAGAEAFLREIGWREFAHHLLYHFPKTVNEPLRKEFLSFPWKKEPVLLKAWQRGETGYPIIDAGMRQLWSIGWMHNRVRMIAASFLVKDLLIAWQEGAAWFWDTLVDADLANNTLGWQWTAGCGADAAPYFRIFNPILQGEKFDPQGHYVRKWLPELQRLPDAYIHKPWQAPESTLLSSGVKLGSSYPFPMVDHSRARESALAAHATITKRGG